MRAGWVLTSNGHVGVWVCARRLLSNNGDMGVWALAAEQQQAHVYVPVGC